MRYDLLPKCGTAQAYLSRPTFGSGRPTAIGSDAYDANICVWHRRQHAPAFSNVVQSAQSETETMPHSTDFKSSLK